MVYIAKKNDLGFYEAQPKPSLYELEKHYSQKYYQEAQGTYSPDYLAEEKQYFHNIARVANETANQLDLNKSLFDLGCGEGFFAKSFHSFGWDVSCCDFSEYGITKHNKDMLPHFVGGDIYHVIESQVAEQKKYGLINLQNVLEHVIEPVDLLNKLKHLLGKKSAIKVRVPNDYSDFQCALVERGKTENTWFAPPEHLSYFNKDGLINIFQHCGYRLVSLQADFPIEIFLANKHSNYWKERALGKEAHLTRVFCENHLIEKNIGHYIEYSKAAAQLGFGRELIAYATPL